MTKGRPYEGFGTACPGCAWIPHPSNDLQESRPACGFVTARPGRAWISRPSNDQLGAQYAPFNNDRLGAQYAPVNNDRQLAEILLRNVAKHILPESGCSEVIGFCIKGQKRGQKARAFELAVSAVRRRRRTPPGGSPRLLQRCMLRTCRCDEAMPANCRRVVFAIAFTSAGAHRR